MMQRAAKKAPYNCRSRTADGVRRSTGGILKFLAFRAIIALTLVLHWSCCGLRFELERKKLSKRYREEERIVAELELLNIRYLSRTLPDTADSVRPSDVLLADLVQQPSARVRAAVIAVFLAHPEYAAAVPAALERLGPTERLTLRFFYTAAVLLQQEHTERLRRFVASRQLPDQFSTQLNLPGSTSTRQRLMALGRQHRQQTRVDVNWVGTYESVARRLLRSWELEARWNR